MDRERVIIIGAGAAGLSVAKQLQPLDRYEVIHLEAQNYVGGRVKSVSFSGLTLDSGARFLHHKELALYPQAKQRKWLSKLGKVAIILNGQYLPTWRFALFHILPSLQKSKRLISAFYRNSDPQKTIEMLIAEQGMNEATSNYFRQLLGSSLGCDVGRVAVTPLRDSFKAAGVRVEQDLINQPLKQPLAKLLQAYFSTQFEQVRLGHAVTEIDYSGTDIHLRCANGELFTADKVVITTSLATLKQQRIRFAPAIPQQHQDAIDRLGMGQGGLFFLHFTRRFWKKGLCQLINADNRYHFWIPDKEQSVIVVFYVADEGDEVGEPQRLQQLLQTLSTVFKCDAASLLDKHHHENWSENPAIGGLYSYDGIGSEGARSMLQQPIDQRLFFAGEATIEGHFATVDGAIISGQRAADQLQL